MSFATNNFDFFYLFLIIVFLAFLVFYLREVILTYRNKKKHASRRSDRSKQSSSRQARRKGKRCPECRHIIDWRRTACHHCGHKFEVNPDREPHPDEIKDIESAK